MAIEYGTVAMMAMQMTRTTNPAVRVTGFCRSPVKCLSRCSGIEQRQAGCAKVPGLFSVACHFGVRSLLAWASARRTPSASKSAV